MNEDTRSKFQALLSRVTASGTLPADPPSDRRRPVAPDEEAESEIYEDEDEDEDEDEESEDAVDIPGFTYEDVPPAEFDGAYWISVRRADPSTYPKSTHRSGKWMVFAPPERINGIWSRVRTAVIDGVLGGSAKVSSRYGAEGNGSGDHVICVYTYDYEDKEEVFRVRRALGALGVTWAISYKTDTATLSGKYSRNGDKVSLYRAESDGTDPFSFGSASEALKPVVVKPKAVAPPRLSVELVPSSSWYSNVRSEVSKSEWDRIRRDVYQEAGNRCEICQGRGPAHPVECHEVWAYDDEEWTQTLVRMQALCPSCHEVKHIGLAGVRGRGQIARAHLAKVNGWSAARAEEYVHEQFEVFKARSTHEWELDLSYLTRWGIRIAE